MIANTLFHEPSNNVYYDRSKQIRGQALNELLAHYTYKPMGHHQFVVDLRLGDFRFVFLQLNALRIDAGALFCAFFVPETRRQNLCGITA
jgi:hypothetical protein